MQLLGIGFAKKSWNSLTEIIQKQLSHQLNSHLYNNQNLNSSIETASKETQNVIIDIITIKPDWIILYPGYFNNPMVCLKLIELLKKESDKKLHFVMVIETLKKNMNSFLKLIPEFELVNKMSLRLTAPELILDHNIKTFPRIKLDNEFKKINYKNNLGEITNHSPNELPLNTIVSLKNINKFITNQGELNPKKWLRLVLKKKEKSIQLEHVLGILSEKKGCYLFPGIPFNSILKIKFNNLNIDHFIRLDECKTQNPPFKRFINSMVKEFQLWLKENKKIPKVKKLPIYCFTKNSVLKNILENLFNEMSHQNVKIISEINFSKNFLNNSFKWLKLNNSPDSEIHMANIDWSGDLIKILKPLTNFINLNELELLEKITFLPIHKIEFEKLKKKLSKQEIETQKIISRAEVDEKIFSQEFEVLQKLDLFSKLLIEALAFCRPWEEAYEESSFIKQKKILLFCEEENSAAELNLKLKNVQKKLWINPFKIKNPEDFNQLDTKMIVSYFSPRTIVINSASKKHLENLCRKTKKECERAKKDLNEINLKIRHSRTDLNLIRKNKKHLALRWLDVSFKQLLYRDRHLFKTFSEKLA